MKHAQQHGLTLIELLVTIVILTILAVITIPLYQQYTRDVRLKNARMALVKNAQFMERHYQQHRTFKKNSTTWPTLPHPETEHFCIGLQGNPQGANDGRFTLKAVAKDPTDEPRVLRLNESLITTVCERSSSRCSELDGRGNGNFSGRSNTNQNSDQNCSIFTS